MVVVTISDGEGDEWYPPPGSGVLDRRVDTVVGSATDHGMGCLAGSGNRAARAGLTETPGTRRREGTSAAVAASSADVTRGSSASATGLGVL